MDSFLLKSQRNEVLKLIQKNKLNPVDFEWTVLRNVYGGHIGSKLIYKDTEYYFDFSIDRNRHYCSFSPGEHTPSENGSSDYWEDQLGYFKEWLIYLKREINAQDLWEVISSEKNFIETSTQAEDNRNLSESEINKINSNLEEIKEFLINAHHLREAEQKFIISRFDYLVESSRRLRQLVNFLDLLMIL